MAVDVGKEEKLGKTLKVHGQKNGNTAMCGKHVGQFSTQFGTLDEITCRSCRRIINKKFDLKEKEGKVKSCVHCGRDITGAGVNVHDKLGGIDRLSFACNKACAEAFEHEPEQL
jgi:hypothetical protein